MCEILSKIHGSRVVPPPTLPTQWMYMNSVVRITGDMDAVVLLIGFFAQKMIFPGGKKGVRLNNHSGILVTALGNTEVLDSHGWELGMVWEELGYRKAETL